MSIDLLPQHAPHPFFGVSDDDCMTVEGVRLTEIAAQVGGTPFYVYARSHLTERVRQLRSLLPREVELHYAIKANPHPAVVAHMATLVDGLDVASARELRVAIESGMRAADISFAGPGKTVEELEQAVAAGILLNVESPLEVARLAEIAGRARRTPDVAVRVNPDFEL